MPKKRRRQPRADMQWLDEGADRLINQFLQLVYLACTLLAAVVRAIFLLCCR